MLRYDNDTTTYDSGLFIPSMGSSLFVLRPQKRPIRTIFCQNLPWEATKLPEITNIHSRDHIKITKFDDIQRAFLAKICSPRVQNGPI